MPGLSQLKKLSEDVLRLGNEPKLRAERGEKPVVAAIPSTVEDIDDSEDFVLGMPEKPEEVSEEENFEQNQDESDALAAAGDLESILDGTATQSSVPVEPDFSSILNPIGGEDDGVPDLSAFEEPPPPPKKKEPSIADMDLDALLSMPSEDFSEPEPELEENEAFDDRDASVSVEENDSSSLSDEEDEFAFTGDSIDMNEDLPEELREVPGDPLKNKLSQAKKEVSLESDVETEESGNESTEFNAPPVSDYDIPDDFSIPEMSDSDFGDGAEATEFVPDEIPTSGETDFEAIDNSSLDDFGTMGNFSAPSMDDAGSFDLDSSMQSGFNTDTASEADSDFDPASLDLSGLNLGDDDAGGDFAEGGTPEVFDTSEMNGVDFSSESGSMSDFNIPDTDSQLNGSSDFELDSEGAGEPDFEIAGYTGVDANPFDKSGRIKSQIPEPDPEVRKKNTLTDLEYTHFKNNLKYYPLNVRLAIEDLIVKNEFTDDVIFEVVEKVLKKVPARQLASHLEKMLDITLSVPRDFERRTAEEYEAYKQSLQYQLKNRIIPAVIIGLFVFLIGFCSVYLGIDFIYKPLRAEKFYREGYALIENNQYPQSEIMFYKALDLKQKKKWFFKYAEGYREHKQYDRAEMMYKNILRLYNHDKQGGLDYVHMELDDLANYPKAEQIVRREVLDYHVNDKDALLLLGDIYLEWGTEEDPSKFSDAFEQYSILCQLYGATNDYLARLMRYHVRTDSLKDVLADKEMFYPNENSLVAEDWTEMSGYLMDKLYGELSPQEEYLREKIEDVHSMLVRAVKKDPVNPISRYNISRYYIESGDHLRAIEGLKKTLELFELSRHMKKRDVYKQLNTYRLLGEQYIYSRDYILAQETLVDGISLFEKKKVENALESDRNVGVMYADMADIDYFISGDLENAERNYINSINNKNDNPSVRYRVGYIQYGNKDYDTAFKNFIIASQDKDSDNNLMLALGNTLALRDDNYASSGYYERLLDSLNLEIGKKDVLFPQVKEEDTALVEAFMKASNNLGVTEFRLARQTGNSSMNGESIYHFQNSLRAWDALTRNQETMVRLGGTNLAEQNIKYVTSPITSYEPAIYTNIPRILENEKALE